MQRRLLLGAPVVVFLLLPLAGCEDLLEKLTGGDQKDYVARQGNGFNRTCYVLEADQQNPFAPTILWRGKGKAAANAELRRLVKEGKCDDGSQTGAKPKTAP